MFLSNFLKKKFEMRFLNKPDFLERLLMKSPSNKKLYLTIFIRPITDYLCDAMNVMNYGLKICKINEIS